MILNLKNAKKKIVGGSLVLSTAATMSGCTIFSGLIKNNSAPSNTITEENKTVFNTNTFLSEKEIRENCENLGIDYNDININSAEMKKNAYITSFDWRDENSDGVLMQRAIKENSVYVRIYYSSDLSANIKSAIKASVDEINLIGDAIGDPIYYLCEENSNDAKLNPYDAYICYGKTVNDALTTFKYDCQTIGENNICCNPVVYLNKSKAYSFSSNEAERAILYEIATHICALQEDSYVSADKKVLSKKVLNSGLSISNGNRNITSGDILIRAAKFSGVLTLEQCNDIIDFARDYEAKYNNKFLSEINSYRVTEDLTKLSNLLGMINDASYTGVAKSASELISQINIQKPKIIEEIRNKFDSNVDDFDSFKDFQISDTTYLKTLHKDYDSYFRLDNNSLSGKIFKKNNNDYVNVSNFKYNFSLKNFGENGIIKIGGALTSLKLVGSNVYLLGLNKDSNVIINKIGEIITKEQYQSEISSNYEKMYEYIAKKQTEISQNY